MFTQVQWGGELPAGVSSSAQKGGKLSVISMSTNQVQQIPHKKAWNLKNLQKLVKKKTLSKISTNEWGDLILPYWQNVALGSLPLKLNKLLLPSQRKHEEAQLARMLGRILADDLKRTVSKTGLACVEEDEEVIAPEMAQKKSPTDDKHLIILDSRERSLCALLKGLPFVRVETLDLGDIVFEHKGKKSLVFERKRMDDLHQGIVSSKFMQQRARLTDLKEAEAGLKIVLLHESPFWACQSNQGESLPHNKFLKTLKTRSKGLKCEELVQSFLVSTVFTHKIPTIDTAHVYHTALIILDFYRLWCKNQQVGDSVISVAEEQRRLAVSKAKKTTRPYSNKREISTVAMLAVSVGASKAVSIQREFGSLAHLASLATKDRASVHRRVAALEYGPQKGKKRRKIGPGTAETFLKTIGF